MQIKRAAPKKLPPLSQPLKTLYKKLLHCTEQDLPTVVPEEWIWLKGDLHHWIPVLNRFDTLLQQLAQDYVSKKPPASATQASNATSSDSQGRVDAHPRITTTSQSAAEKKETSDARATLPLQPLDARRRGILMSVLQMTRLLLENCTNRSLYNSYEVPVSCSLYL